MSKEKIKYPRKKWFLLIRNFLKIFIRKPKIIYLGEEFKDQSIILSNHAGKSSPLMLDCYFPRPFRFWGTYEMNSGLKSVYKYLSEDYYHQKMKWKLFWSKAFCLIAAPLVNLFYKGLNLISTYPDSRFKTSIKESVKTINNNQSIVIFPEDSSDGYFDEMKYFYAGFLVLAKTCFKKGVDLPIYLTYYNVKKRKYIVDKPIYYSELIKDGKNKYEIAEILKNRTNELQNIEI